MSEHELYPKQYLYRRVVRAKLFIDEHFASHIDLDRVADKACYSKFHFARLFRDIYGRTPHQYLTYVRIEHAIAKLSNGASVKEACYGVGFDSVQSFAGLFKRRLGVTPAEFRRRREEFAEELREIPLKYVPNCFVEKKGWGRE